MCEHLDYTIPLQPFLFVPMRSHIPVSFLCSSRVHTSLYRCVIHDNFHATISGVGNMALGVAGPHTVPFASVASRIYIYIHIERRWRSHRIICNSNGIRGPSRSPGFTYCNNIICYSKCTSILWMHGRILLARVLSDFRP